MSRDVMGSQTVLQRPEHNFIQIKIFEKKFDTSPKPKKLKK
jgi:hypothetical protein